MTAATAEKRETIPPTSNDDASIEQERRLAVADALKQLQEQHVEFINSSTSAWPGFSLFEASGRLFVAASVEPQIPWPSTCWEFLESLDELARSFRELQTTPSGSALTWPGNVVATHVQRCERHIETLRDPAPPQPRRQKLESPDRLRDEKLSIAQIARLYEVSTDDAQLIMDGEKKAPTHKIFPVKASKLRRQPSLASVDLLADMMLNAHDEQQEDDQE